MCRPSYHCDALWMSIYSYVATRYVIKIHSPLHWACELSSRNLLIEDEKPRFGVGWNEMMRSERVSRIPVRQRRMTRNAWEQFNLNPNLGDDTFSQIDSRGGKRRKKSDRVSVLPFKNRWSSCPRLSEWLEMSLIPFACICEVKLSRRWSFWQVPKCTKRRN